MIVKIQADEISAIIKERIENFDLGVKPAQKIGSNYMSTNKRLLARKKRKQKNKKRRN